MKSLRNLASTTKQDVSGMGGESMAGHQPLKHEIQNTTLSKARVRLVVWFYQYFFFLSSSKYSSEGKKHTSQLLSFSGSEPIIIGKSSSGLKMGSFKSP